MRSSCRRNQRRTASAPFALGAGTHFDLAQAHESAAKHVKDLQASQSPGEVHAVSNKSPIMKDATVHDTSNSCRCGGDHCASKCMFRESECLHCGKKGHIAKVCRSKLRGVPPKCAPQRGQAHTYMLIDDEPMKSQMQCTPCMQSGVTALHPSTPQLRSTRPNCKWKWPLVHHCY